MKRWSMRQLCCSGVLVANEAHVRPQDRFADSLGISGIILLAFEIGLHVGRRHQAHRVAERLQLTRPMLDVAHASMPTRQGEGFLKKASTYRRFNWRRITTPP